MLADLWNKLLANVSLCLSLKLCCSFYIGWASAYKACLCLNQALGRPTTHWMGYIDPPPHAPSPLIPTLPALMQYCTVVQERYSAEGSPYRVYSWIVLGPQLECVWTLLYSMYRLYRGLAGGLTFHMREQYRPSPTPPVRGYMGFILGRPFWTSPWHIYSIKAPIVGIWLVSGHQLGGYGLHQGTNGTSEGIWLLLGHQMKGYGLW